MEEKERKGLWNIGFGEIGATLKALEDRGVTLEHLARLRGDKEFAKKVAEFILGDGRESTESSIRPELARAIMGENFFGVEEAVKHFGVNPTCQQLASLSEIPFSEAVLEESKNTHVLVAVFPLSILEIRGKVNSKLFYDQSWYSKESFAKERDKVSWQLVRKTPVVNSISKNWQEQQLLLGKNDEVPSARVMVYIIIGHYLATGERLFKHIGVRTSSVDSVGDRVGVGYFDSDGLAIDLCWDDSRGDCLGVSSARKF